jgi:hypothetical protein
MNNVTEKILLALITMGLSQKKLDEIALFQANIAKAKKADPKGYKKEANVIGWNNQLGGYISAPPCRYA